jgi:hypothetical protein
MHFEPVQHVLPAFLFLRHFAQLVRGPIQSEAPPLPDAANHTHNASAIDARARLIQSQI